MASRDQINVEYQTVRTLPKQDVIISLRYEMRDRQLYKRDDRNIWLGKAVVQYRRFLLVNGFKISCLF